MIVNTLGPNKSDSYNAAVNWLKNSDGQIITYASFEDIFNNIDNLIEEYIIMPVGFENKYTGKNWVHYHFTYIKKLDVINTFILKTKEMYLIENVECKNLTAIIHSSTESFLKNNIDDKVQVFYENSKCLAYEKFLNGQYKYCIASKDVFEEKSYGQIIKQFTPTMVWIVYLVRK